MQRGIVFYIEYFNILHVCNFAQYIVAIRRDDEAEEGIDKETEMVLGWHRFRDGCLRYTSLGSVEGPPTNTTEGPDRISRNGCQGCEIRWHLGTVQWVIGFSFTTVDILDNSIWNL